MSKKSYQLTYIILFSCLIISPSFGLQRGVSISSIGKVNYQVVLKINFEDPSHFEYGSDTIWNKPTGLGPSFPDNIFEPSAEVAHSPSRSARLELKNPVDDDARRIHVCHKWSPSTDKHLWLSCWIYLPLNFEVDDWNQLVKSIEERWHVKGQPWTPGPYYNSFQICVLISNLGRVREGEYKLCALLNQGYVDNDGNRVSDLGPEYKVETRGTIRFGEWFNVKTYVYRDPNDGILQMWLNGKLEWNLINVRTMGISPERLEDPTVDAWLSSGIGLYAGNLPNVSPKYVFFDDIVLSSSETDPTA